MMKQLHVHIGTRVRKNHTSKRGAFQTVGDDPAFLIVNNEIHNNMKADFFTDKDFDPKIKINEKVALVKYHPGYEPPLLKYIINSNYKAIIFEGTGLGHIGENMYSMVKMANEKGHLYGNDFSVYRRQSEDDSLRKWQRFT